MTPCSICGKESTTTHACRFVVPVSYTCPSCAESWNLKLPIELPSIQKALADARDEAYDRAAFIARHAKGPWNAMHVEALEAAQKAVLALKGKPYLAAAHPEGKHGT